MDKNDSLPQSPQQFSARIISFAGIAARFGLKPSQPVLVLPGRSTPHELAIVPDSVPVKELPDKILFVPRSLVIFDKIYKAHAREEAELNFLGS